MQDLIKTLCQLVPQNSCKIEKLKIIIKTTVQLNSNYKIVVVINKGKSTKKKPFYRDKTDLVLTIVSK